MFDLAETKGLHILPVHYYTPIPTAADLKRRRQSSMTGVPLNLETGISCAVGLIQRRRDGIVSLCSGSRGYRADNDSFAPLDAAVLYSIICEAKPKRIVEIGSGMSTLAMLAAIEDARLEVDLTCIEPYLPDYLQTRRNVVNRVIEKPLQEVPLDIFLALEAGDILFIDSTHVVRFDSDVVYEILEILPRLQPGVLVHVHDIFFPYDYPEKWLKQHRFFWTEQYLLQAFLSMNPHFEIQIPLHAIKKKVIEQSQIIIPETKTEVTSLWLVRK
ncbi:class I SAM-dependent methyltransferase [Bradyrhizobium sp. CCBAU 11434]|uniref:class I SAM-dependent methyltransferase n=1 Tax=Bradyrhizobium sp. CCBAU 11434 TaxID=1630885 RepID=UPI0023050BA2|nr:class I SAM-dependent methyltransferase [Bradyrhizobium sp. CCBAU 11434]